MSLRAYALKQPPMPIFSKNIEVDKFGKEGYRPSIYVDNNLIYVAWEYCRIRNGPLCRISDIYLATSSDYGKTFRQEIVAKGEDFGCTDFCVLEFPVVKAENNKIYVAYVAILGISNRELYVSHSEINSDGANPRFIHTKVNNPLISNNVGQVDLEVKNNEVYALWNNYETNKNHIYFSKSIDNGNHFLENVQVDSSDGTKNVFQPDVLVKNNKIYAVWQDYRHIFSGSIYFTKSLDDGISFEKDVPVFIAVNSTQYGGEPSIEVENNNVYVAFMGEKSISNYKILFSKSLNDGVSFDEARAITTYESSRNPSLLLTKDKVLHLIWFSNKGGSDYDIYYSKSYDKEHFFGNVRVDDAPQYTFSGDPTAAIDKNNNIYVTWQDFRGDGQSKIFFSTTKKYPSIDSAKTVDKRKSINKELSVD